MTINTSASRAAALAAAGQQNNPIVLWDNLATVANIGTIIGTEAGGPPQNAVTGTTFDAAILTVNVSNNSDLIVTGAGLAANCAMVYAHNIADTGASARISYSDDGSTYTSVGSLVTPTDNQAIIWRFDSVTPAHSWRVQIVGVTTGNPIIGGFFVGQELIFDRRFYQGYRPPITPNGVDVITNVSEGAHLMGSRFVERGSLVSASLRNISPATLRGATWQGFQRHYNAGKGFGWAWRPDTFGDAHWGWRSGDPLAPTITGPQELMGFDMAMRLYDE